MGQDNSIQASPIEKSNQELQNKYENVYQRYLDDLQSDYLKKMQILEGKMRLREITQMQYQQFVQQYQNEYRVNYEKVVQRYQLAKHQLSQQGHQGQLNEQRRVVRPLDSVVRPLDSAVKPLDSAVSLSHLRPEERDLLEWAYYTLGISLDADENEMKVRYMSLIRENHPDRGGNKIIFDNVQKAYGVIKDFKEPATSHAKRMGQPVVNQEYSTDLHDGRENIYLDRKNFDQDKFNKLFSEVRIDNPYDRGYGNKMAESSGKNRETINIQKTVKGDFHGHFKQNCTTDIIEYKEPEFMSNTFGGNCEELGVDQVNDFSGNEGTLAYTDYMQAHNDDQKYLDAEAIAEKMGRGRSKTLEQLKSERESISYKLDSREQQRIQEEEARTKRQESERLRRMQELDQRYQDQYNRINQRLLN